MGKGVFMGTEYICYDNRKIPVEYLDKMDIKELEQIHYGLQNKMTKIISDRTRFQSENTFPKNDNEYWNKMRSYKYALTKTQSQLHLVKTKMKSKNVENSNKKDKFYYMFFKTSQAHLSKELFEMLMEQTVNILNITGMSYSVPDIEDKKE